MPPYASGPQTMHLHAIVLHSIQDGGKDWSLFGLNPLHQFVYIFWVSQ